MNVPPINLIPWTLVARVCALISRIKNITYGSLVADVSYGSSWNHLHSPVTSVPGHDNSTKFHFASDQFLLLLFKPNGLTLGNTAVNYTISHACICAPLECITVDVSSAASVITHFAVWIFPNIFNIEWQLLIYVCWCCLNWNLAGMTETYNIVLQNTPGIRDHFRGI